MRLPALLLAAVAMTALAGSAGAATCPASGLNAVMLGGSAQPCAPGDEKDDKTSNASPAKWTVNEDGIFGGGWSVFQRSNQPGVDFGDLDFAAGSTDTGGSFRLASGFWDRYGDAMVVFDGSNAGKVSPGEYLAFRLKPDTYGAYAYVTPFLESGARGALTPSGIQSLTLYAKPVPLPPAALLFLTALGGVGLLSRKRRAA
jgi:hypothetical protein